MISTEASQLVATIAVAVAVVSGALAGAACLVNLRLRDRDGGYALLARQFLAVMTTAGMVALVADHAAVWHLVPAPSAGLLPRLTIFQRTTLALAIWPAVCLAAKHGSYWAPWCSCR